MDERLQMIALKIFVSLGGVAAILAVLRKGTAPCVRAAVHWMVGENHPVLRQLVLAHREWVEGVFDAADLALKEQLEVEAAAPAPVAPSQSAGPASLVADPRVLPVPFFKP
jgi:hypothetical protein